MKWTKDQENSIYARPSEIVVSAAAGSGKTQVLITRIIERIKNNDEPVSVEKLLVVTFTKAAAAEMRERIGKALRKEIKETDSSERRKHLKEQLSLLGSAQICTIDSFCYDVVKQNFYKADLPSDISIGESGELSLLKLSALEETVNSFYSALEKYRGNKLSEENLRLAETVENYFKDKDELSFILDGFDALSNACSYDKRDSEFSENIKGDGDYTTMISKLYSKAQSAAYPEKWLRELSDMYDNSVIKYTDTPVYKYACHTCKNALKDASDAIRELADISSANDIGYETFLYNESDTLAKFSDCATYKELYDFYTSTPIFATITGAKSKCNKEIRSSITATRGKIRDNIRKKVLARLLQFSPEECESLRNQLYPQIKALCSAALLLGDIYYKKMTARRIIDFSTCEHLALNMVSEDGVTLTDVGEALKKRYDEIYIDEFQDSNDLQDMLFSLISSGRTFVVGDVKQSIYGFRNADPSIFMKRCDSSFFDENSEKRKIILSKNFRSSKCVVNGVNSIFDITMIPSFCGLDYKKEHRLEFGTDFIPENIPNEKCDLAIITGSENAENQRYDEILYIASEIKELIKSQRTVWDKDDGKYRPIKYSDIAVLARSTSGISDIFESVFSSEGIPCFVDGGNDLYDTVEIGQILEILKLIDNAQSDISLACALRSPMFMFDENELLKIKLKSNISFCDAFYGICASKYKVSPQLGKKCRNFMTILNSWRSVAGFVTVEELIRRIYTDTNIYSSVLSFPDGQIRRANLDLLLEKAEEFEKSTYSGLFNFINYIEKIKKTSESVGEAKSISEKMDVVRLMTIHKSKGLEFPIVFLTACSKPYLATKTTAGGMIINSHAGIGMNVINPLIRCRYKSPVQSVLLELESRENAREEMRLLYVALTRAREKLYVVGALSNINKFEDSQYNLLEKLTANEITYANSYLSLLALAYARGADKYWNLKITQTYEKNDSSEDLDSSEKEFTEDKYVSELLDYSYPYLTSIYLPNKVSVSFLKSADINLAPSEDGNIPMLNQPSCRKIAFNKPSFDTEKKSGTFFGNVHHKVLQHINFKLQDTLSQCKTMLNKGILTKEEFDAIDFDKLNLFLSSPLGVLLSKADRLYREEPFVISINANEINPTLPADEVICVQGIIDCYFEYENSIVLIDYKTDYYVNPEEIVKKYEKQLLYYEKALKSKFNNNVIQKYLYLMHKGDIIRL